MVAGSGWCDPCEGGNHICGSKARPCGVLSAQAGCHAGRLRAAPTHQPVEGKRGLTLPATLACTWQGVAAARKEKSSMKCAFLALDAPVSKALPPTHRRTASMLPTAPYPAWPTDLQALNTSSRAPKGILTRAMQCAGSAPCIIPVT